jgi:hypothetical protein
MTQIFLHSLLSLMLLAQSVLYDPERPDLVAFAYDGFDPGINRSIGGGDADKKILQRFGQPRLVECRLEPEKREPVIVNEVKTWHYDGLEIVTTGSVKSLARGIEQISLTNPAYKLKFGLKIGSPKAAFIKRLGRPWREEPRLIQYPAIYHASSEGVAFVSEPELDIEFDAKDRAKKITWTYGSH